MTVACVLSRPGNRTGGKCYGPEWLWAIKRKLPSGITFRYLSDEAPGPWRIPLMHDWPGWWAKIELFRPGVFDGPVLYFDLDTLVVGDVSHMQSDGFAILRDFYKPKRIQSAVMAWTPGDHTAAIYERFADDPARYMRRFRSDQEFIEDTLGVHGYVPDILQDLYPDEIVSLKVHARKRCPEGARLVCGHGRPRLNDPLAGWAHKEWAA